MQPIIAVLLNMVSSNLHAITCICPVYRQKGENLPREDLTNYGGIDQISNLTGSQSPCMAAKKIKLAKFDYFIKLNYFINSSFLKHRHKNF